MLRLAPFVREACDLLLSPSAPSLDLDQPRTRITCTMRRWCSSSARVQETQYDLVVVLCVFVTNHTPVPTRSLYPWHRRPFATGASWPRSYLRTGTLLHLVLVLGYRTSADYSTEAACYLDLLLASTHIHAVHWRDEAPPPGGHLAFAPQRAAAAPIPRG